MPDPLPENAAENTLRTALLLDEARLSAPISAAMVDLAALKPGMSVLDLATGVGEPALAAARVVGPTGRVWGIDLDDAALTVARARAPANTTFVHGDVADLSSAPGPFDAVTCRWGLASFADPRAVLREAARQAAPGAVLVVAVWGQIADCPWSHLPREGYFPLATPDPEVPGAHRYADPAHLRAHLRDAGWTPTDELVLPGTVFEGSSGEEVVTWARAVLPWLVARLPHGTEPEWASSLAKRAEGLREDGVIRLGGVTRIVRGVRAR